jgi:type IV secretory pathway VirJ component
MNDTPERIWIEDPEEKTPYFYEESELGDVAAPVVEYVRADLVAAVQARAEAAEAKLARAVKALLKIADRPDYRLPSARDIARAALADLDAKGGAE